MNRELMSDDFPGLKLDPRTKLVLLLAMAVFVMGGAGSMLPIYLYGILCFLPFGLLYSCGQWQKASTFLLLYLLIYVLERALLEGGDFPGLLVLMMVCSIYLRFIPCILMGAYALTTTRVSQFIGAMEKIHVPQELTIPMSVIFRFFPTICQEFSAIGDAMKLRGISLGKCGLGKLAEYRMVPLMICSVQIGEDLSAAALSRGLTTDVRRTNICRLRLKVQDYALMGLTVICSVWGIVNYLCWN